ncbi:MAG: hypothetical protein HGA76_04745, partial [Candidatus Firestonebacteria bacterium]|nr:hypothetical protein [Candidatus Firestonebacteria bacterium]
MKILFWIEPVIEMERPFGKQGWADYFSYKLIRALQNSVRAHEVECYFAINEAIHQVFEELPKIPRIVFTQNELLKPFKDYLEAGIAWFNGTYTTAQLTYYQNLVREKLGGVVPDVIITFSPAPFLQTAFPRACLLYHEYSLFSRAPFPETWYFDPVGMNGSAYMTKYHDAIFSRLVLTPVQERRVDEFKRQCRELLTAKDPFREVMAAHQSRFKQMALLPLMVSGTYTFDAYFPYKNQFQFLTDILDKLPGAIGLVVTTHPDYDILDDYKLTYLRRKYPNFIYEPSFSEYYASSQFLIRYVDIVINATSTIGLHTLVWDKKLICLTPRYFGFLGDAATVEDLPAVLEQPLRDRRKY